MKTRLFQKKYRIDTERLQYFDYGAEAGYYVTLCTEGRRNRFGKLENHKMILNEIGLIIEKNRKRITEFHPNTSLEEFVVMTNHFHGVVFIDKKLNLGGKKAFHLEKHTLGDIIRGFKAGCTSEIKKIQPNFGWQRNYYEHIIKDEADLERIRNYIINNPLKHSIKNMTIIIGEIEDIE